MYFNTKVTNGRASIKLPDSVTDVDTSIRMNKVSFQPGLRPFIETSNEKLEWYVNTWSGKVNDYKGLIEIFEGLRNHTTTSGTHVINMITLSVFKLSDQTFHFIEFYAMSEDVLVEEFEFVHLRAHLEAFLRKLDFGLKLPDDFSFTEYKGWFENPVGKDSEEYYISYLNASSAYKWYDDTTITVSALYLTEFPCSYQRLVRGSGDLVNDYEVSKRLSHLERGVTATRNPSIKIMGGGCVSKYQMIKTGNEETGYPRIFGPNGHFITRIAFEIETQGRLDHFFKQVTVPNTIYDVGVLYRTKFVATDEDGLLFNMSPVDGRISFVYKQQTRMPSPLDTFPLRFGNTLRITSSQVGNSFVSTVDNQKYVGVVYQGDESDYSDLNEGHFVNVEKAALSENILDLQVRGTDNHGEYEIPLDGVLVGQLSIKLGYNVINQGQYV